MRWLRYLPIFLTVCLLAVAAMLPGLSLAQLRQRLPLFSELINIVEAIQPGVDSTHVLIFLLVGAALVLAFAHLRGLALLAMPITGVVVLALVSEFVQFWVPGRTPLWSDVRDDLVGGVLGVLLASVLVWLWRRWRPARPLE
ncbi:MAG: hypothetical protein DCF27_12180 [Lysobacteraceae bacterium]|nr:MAG: hypothetical protein DCF27_12180 [Xanthomonadaceae bacterium]